MTREGIRAWPGRLTLLVGAILLGALIAEAALRVAYPRSDDYLVLPAGFDVTYDPMDELAGVSGTARYRTNSLGIRGAELSDADEYRVLAIGGSTTQVTYLDEDESWPLALGGRLDALAGGPRVWSGDIGRSGHTSRSHRLQLELFAPQVPDLDAVVMLIGFNDMAAAMRQGTTYRSPPPLDDPAARSTQSSEAFVSLPGGLHDRDAASQSEGVSFLKRTALYGLARVARRAWAQRVLGEAPQWNGDLYRVWREYRANAAMIVDEAPPLEAPLADYRENLHALIDLAEAQGLRLVLLTAPALWRADLTPEEASTLWMGGIGRFQSGPGHAYYSPGVLADALEQYNAALLAVCEVRSVECIDLDRMIPRDTSMFIDDVHFSERGSLLTADSLAAYLSRTPPFVSEASPDSR